MYGLKRIFRETISCYISMFLGFHILWCVSVSNIIIKHSKEMKNPYLHNTVNSEKIYNRQSSYS